MVGHIENRVYKSHEYLIYDAKDACVVEALRKGLYREPLSLRKTFQGNQERFETAFLIASQTEHSDAKIGIALAYAAAILDKDSEKNYADPHVIWNQYPIWHKLQSFYKELHDRVFGVNQPFDLLEFKRTVHYAANEGCRNAQLVQLLSIPPYTLQQDLKNLIPHCPGAMFYYGWLFLSKKVDKLAMAHLLWRSGIFVMRYAEPRMWVEQLAKKEGCPPYRIVKSSHSKLAVIFMSNGNICCPHSAKCPGWFEKHILKIETTSEQIREEVEAKVEQALLSDICQDPLALRKLFQGDSACFRLAFRRAYESHHYIAQIMIAMAYAAAVVDNDAQKNYSDPVVSFNKPLVYHKLQHFFEMLYKGCISTESPCAESILELTSSDYYKAALDPMAKMGFIEARLAQLLCTQLNDCDLKTLAQEGCAEAMFYYAWCVLSKKNKIKMSRLFWKSGILVFHYAEPGQSLYALAEQKGYKSYQLTSSNDFGSFVLFTTDGGVLCPCEAKNLGWFEKHILTEKNFDLSKKEVKRRVEIAFQPDHLFSPMAIRQLFQGSMECFMTAFRRAYEADNYLAELTIAMAYTAADLDNDEEKDYTDSSVVFNQPLVCDRLYDYYEQLYKKSIHKNYFSRFARLSGTDLKEYYVFILQRAASQGFLKALLVQLLLNPHEMLKEKLVFLVKQGCSEAMFHYAWRFLKEDKTARIRLLWNSGIRTFLYAESGESLEAFARRENCTSNEIIKSSDSIPYIIFTPNGSVLCPSEARNPGWMEEHILKELQAEL